MALRFCPTCKADVEDVGGYCRLGHRLKLEPFAEPLDEPAPPPPPPPPQEMEETVREKQASLYKALEDDEIEAGPDEITAFSPPPRATWGPDKSKRRKR